VAELLNGELHTTPRPALRHARVATVLGSEIVGPFDRGRGWEQQRSGCVCVASPPSFNPRLASQQGVFLVNCAESLTFRQSLNRIMKSQTSWCKTVDIEAGAMLDIEERLFRMNVHAQSLFPDMEGLAGLIQQRARLHWK
jgi:hypothetical protein